MTQAEPIIRSGGTGETRKPARIVPSTRAPTAENTQSRSRSEETLHEERELLDDDAHDTSIGDRPTGVPTGLVGTPVRRDQLQVPAAGSGGTSGLTFPTVESHAAL